MMFRKLGVGDTTEYSLVFIPVVVETYGVWTPFAKSVIKTIATRTTIKSGLSRAVAYKNLMEQLSSY